MPLSRITSQAIANSTIITADLANTGVTAATYGSTTQVPSIVISADGRITAAANVEISVLPFSNTQILAQIQATALSF